MEVELVEVGDEILGEPHRPPRARSPGAGPRVVVGVPGEKGMTSPCPEPELGPAPGPSPPPRDNLLVPLSR